VEEITPHSRANIKPVAVGSTGQSGGDSAATVSIRIVTDFGTRMFHQVSAKFHEIGTIINF